MNRVAGNYGYLWVASEICYYLGLVLAALFIPTLALILWMMSLMEKADPELLVSPDHVGVVCIVICGRCDHKKFDLFGRKDSKRELTRCIMVKN